MKKFALACTTAFSLAAFSAPTFAFGDYNKWGDFGDWKDDKWSHTHSPYCEHGEDKPTTPAEPVPEIDAAGAGLALAFVGGILAVRRERRRK